MSKIEDETARGARHRPGASASIDDATDAARVDDFDAEPVIVPASDDWSVDDDSAVTGRTGAADGRSNQPGPAKWADQPIPGLEQPASSNGSTTSQTPTTSNGIAPTKRTQGSAPKVKRFAADRVPSPETERVDVTPADESGTQPAAPGAKVGDPLIAPRTDAKVGDASSTGRVPVIISDDRAEVRDTGPVPLIIHEQTAIEDHDSRTPVIDRDDVDHAFDVPWDTGQAYTVPATTQSQPAVINYGTPAAGISVPAVPPEISRRRRVRRVNRVVRHVDPWSVFKVGLLFNLIGYLVVMTSGVLLWDVASRTGTLPNIERWATQFGWETFALDGGAIFRNAAVAGLFGAVGLTGAMVMFATVFNLVSDAIGGIRVSVLEEEVVAIADDGSAITPSMTSALDQHHAEDWAVEDF